MHHPLFSWRAMLLTVLCALATAVALAQDAGAFKVGAAPPPQDIYTKVNLTEPYNIIEGFTIYPSLESPDLFYYYPKPRVVRTAQGRLVFRLLNYAMAENKNQVGSADVAGGYLQFDVTMAPTPQEEANIKAQLLNPPKRFGAAKLSPALIARTAATSASLHPYHQVWGVAAKPKNIRLAPIPIHNLKAKARIPGILAADKTDTDWFPANGDSSGTTTFAINLSGPQAQALYQAVMTPAAVEPFNVYFSGDLGGYIKCKAKLTVRTSEIYRYLQTQSGSTTKVERPGSRGVSIFGIVDIGGREAYSGQTDKQVNDIDVSQILNTSIKIEGDLQGYDDALMAMAKYGLDQAMARFGQPIALDELMDPKREMKDPTLPPGVGQPGAWAWVGSWMSGGLLQPGKNPGRRAYYGFFDQKSFDRANSANFIVDLDKAIAVTWQYAPSSSIFDDAIVKEIRENGAMYAQKLALNDPFFEKLDITYAANLDFAGGPFNKVVFYDHFKLKDGTNYSVPGLLLEAKDLFNESGMLVGATPPQNMRFGGLLQGNLYQGAMGNAFNILNPTARLSALAARKWPVHEDGSQVKGITHRWKYQVFFRPSTKDMDFPPSWTSPEVTNSDTVLMATIPPKVAVFTVSADGLNFDRVASAVVQVRYRANLPHLNQPNAEIVKSAKLRPGAPDKLLYFYDDTPRTNLPCAYQFKLIYKTGGAYDSPWIASEGGVIVPVDPTDFASSTSTPSTPPTGPVVNDY